MTAQERETFVKEFLSEHCFKLMAGKGAEYSRGEKDVNSNFKRVAEAIGSDPLTVAYVYAAKHWDSISNFVKSRSCPSGEPIEGRLGDMLSYILILGSLIHEQGVADIKLPDTSIIRDLGKSNIQVVKPASLEIK